MSDARPIALPSSPDLFCHRSLASSACPAAALLASKQWHTSSPGCRKRWTRRRWLAAVGGALAITSSADCGAALSGDAAAAAKKEVPWLAEVQKPPAVVPAPKRPLRPLLVDPQGQPIVDRAGWEGQATRLRDEWRGRLGPYWSWTEKRKPPALRVLDEERIAGVVRQLIEYELEPGWPTHAYLMRPSREGGGRAGVVAFHPTVQESIREPAGLVGRPELAFGLNLARRGMIAVCPRNYLWPEDGKIDIPPQLARFEKLHPRSKGMAKMVYDGLVAVDLLASLPEVNPRRIGAIGHSLGAKEALYAAAMDDRVRAAVSSEGGVGFAMTNWHDPWYLGEGVRRGEFPGDHHELLALAAPRPFLLLGGDSADGAQSWPYIEAALAVYRLYGPTSRLGLYNHGRGHTVPPDAESRALDWLATYL